MISTINKTFPVFIGRLDNNITIENIEKFLNTKFKTAISGLKKINLNHNHFSSYYFYIDILEKDIIYSKNEWPQGLIISRYNSPRVQTVTKLLTQAAPTKTTTLPDNSISKTQPPISTNNSGPNANSNVFSNLNDETDNSMESSSNGTSASSNILNN